MSATEWYIAKLRQQQEETEAARLQRWAEVNQLWEQCCMAAGIDPADQAIIFDRDNPYVREYEESVLAYMSTRDMR